VERQWFGARFPEIETEDTWIYDSEQKIPVSKSFGALKPVDPNRDQLDFTYTIDPRSKIPDLSVQLMPPGSPYQVSVPIWLPESVNSFSREIVLNISEKTFDWLRSLFIKGTRWMIEIMWKSIGIEVSAPDNAILGITLPSFLDSIPGGQFNFAPRESLVTKRKVSSSSILGTFPVEVVAEPDFTNDKLIFRIRTITKIADDISTWTKSRTWISTVNVALIPMFPVPFPVFPPKVKEPSTIWLGNSDDEFDFCDL
jgi:hypothetical protein